MKLKKKALLWLGLIFLGVVSFSTVAKGAVTVYPLPDDYYQRIGDIRDYNGFIDGEHSADSADTEGPVIITGDSLFPNDTVTFTFGASFRPVNATVGTPLLDSQVVNVLIDGKVQNYSNAVIAFESGKDGRGWNISNEQMGTWLVGPLASQMIPRYYLDQMKMNASLEHFRKERDILSSYVGKVVSETGATEWKTPPVWGSNGQLPSIPIKHSLVDSHMLVIDLDEVSEFHRGADGLNINGIALYPDLVNDPRFDSIVYTSKREKIVFSGGTFNGGGEISLTDPMAAQYAQKISYYFPNATQITNYAENRQTGNPPAIAAPVGTRNPGVDIFGEDFYKNINNLTYGAATIGSVLAPKATVVYSGGNMNGLLMVKDFHQRDGAELHNFRANWVDREFEPDPKGSLMLIKKSKAENDDPVILPHAKFIMFKEEEGKKFYYGFDGSIGFEWYEERELAYEFETDLDGEIFISGLPAGTYYMEEVKAPEGHQPLGETIEFVITPDNVAQEQMVVETVMNERTPMIDVKGQKIWQDDNNGYDTRPAEVIIQLYRNGVYLKEMAISDENDWRYLFDELPQYDEQNVFYKYTIKEVPVPGYETVISQDNQKVTNTLQGITEIKGLKIWDDVNDAGNHRPDSIIIDLFQNNVRYPIMTQEVTAATNWEYQFSGLEKYDKLGKLIRYRVVEQSVPGYDTSYDPDGTITNTFKPTIDIEGQKVWRDNENSENLRPDKITIELLRNESVIDSKEVTGPDWTYSFTGLDQFDSDDNLYTYRVREVVVPGYHSVVNETNELITNTIAANIDISGEKKWQDSDNGAGIRPEVVFIKLYQNNKLFQVVTADVEGNWRYEFKQVPKYDQLGQLYLYSVEELAVPGYEPIYDENSFDIINRLKPKTEISGQKIWRDDNNSQNTRPDTITVELYLNNKLMDSLVLSEANEWKYSFKDLAVFDKDGNLNVYTIKELNVPNYESQITRDQSKIINTLTGETRVAGEKKWDDGNNNAGARPTAITLELLQNKQPYKTLEVTATTNWKYEFEGLPKYDQDGKLFTYTIKEITVPGYETIYDDNGKDLTNKIQPKIDINGEKIWKDDQNSGGTRPESITVELYLNDVLMAKQELSGTPDWRYSFKDLEQFDKDGNLNVYTIKEIGVPNYESVISRDKQKIVNTLVGSTELTGQKKWEDGENNAGIRPSVITLQLLQNKAVFKTLEVTAATDWKYEFKELPKYDQEGKLYEYTIKEIEVPGYDPIYADNGQSITNKIQPKLDINGEKIWRDNQNAENLRPETITVELYQNGVKLNSVEISKTTDWKYQFTNLDRFDASGNMYIYTIKEISVPSYQTVITRDNQKIINTLVGITEFKGQKKWDDGDNNAGIRPESITVKLLQNGEILKEMNVTASNNWYYHFTDLPKYDENGQRYNYTIEEVQVPGYEAIYSDNGADITNKIQPKINLAGKKIWQDNNNSEGKRPVSVTIELYKGEALLDKLVISEAEDWEYEFKDLDQFDDQGNFYVYTIKEVKVPDYETVVTRDNQKVINTLIGETEINGEKKWLDNENQANLRPDKITINLLQNGQEIKTQEVTASENWRYRFTELAKYDQQGKAYVYTVKEVSVPGYDTIYSDDGLIITNKIQPKVTIEGEKIWQDDNNVTGQRPTTINVELYRNNEFMKKIAVTANENWRYEFKDLDRFDPTDTLYVYTVKEIAVPDYSTVVTRDNQKIINTLVGETEVSGEKVWQDNENQAGLRPTEITVKLLQNGQVYKEQQVTAVENWRYAFKGLPKYDEVGKRLSYTIEEVTVPGYDTIYSDDGLTITNKLQPKVTIEGEKIWRDDNNAQGQRPISITVELYRNNEFLNKVVVSEAEAWHYEFKDLERFDSDGNLYNYTVKEISVPNYETVISRDNQKIINTLVGQTVIKGKKIWEDNQNSENLRPAKITVKLLQNGQEFQAITVSSEENWQYQFDNLPQYDEVGKLFVYTIQEVTVPGYETIYDPNGVDIINKLETTNTTTDSSSTTDTTSTTDSSSTTDTTSTTDSSSTTDTTSTTDSSSTTDTTSTTDSSSTTDTTSTTDSSSTTDTTSTTDSSSTTDTTSTTDSSSTTDTTSTTDSSSTTDTTSTTDSSSTTDTTSTTDSSSTTDTTSTTSTTYPNGGSTSSSPKPGNSLPQTDEQLNPISLAIGIVMVATVTTIFYGRRAKSRE